MATSRSASSTAATGRTRPTQFRLLRRLGWLVVVCGAVIAWLYGPTLAREAHTATAYAARVGCSCRYVAGRPLGSCRRDFVAGMGLVTLGEDAAAHSVTARYALLAPATATYREGAGCILEAWRR